MQKAALVLAPILNVVFMVFNIIIWTVFAWVILSWILFGASHTSFRWRHPGGFRFLETLNDIFGRMAMPFLRPIRRWLGLRERSIRKTERISLVFPTFRSRWKPARGKHMSICERHWN